MTGTWPTNSRRWAVIVPMKPLASAKSRLSAIDGPADLALAFFQDTTTAAAACPSVELVLVATTDETAARWALAHGCRVVDDSSAQGINAAAALAATQAPTDLAIAVVVGDLPCLTPEALADVLAAGAGHPRAFLTDADGTGTTTWMCQPPFEMPRFGTGSRSEHAACGAYDLVAAADDPAWIAARRDIDTVADLAVALEIGLGEYSRAALRGRQQTPE